MTKRKTKCVKARQIWKLGKPQAPGSWVSLENEGRIEWLELALRNRESVMSSDDVISQSVELDGARIDNRIGFYCSLGESVNGPGGYFGRCLDSVDDCLCGGFCVLPPFTLIWHHADMSQEAIDSDAGFSEMNGSYFDMILDVFRSRGVEVVLK